MIYRFVPLLPLLSGVVGRASVFSVSQDDWDALNQTVGGKLYAGHPAARPCYLSAGIGDFDVEACKQVLDGQQNSSWIADTFGAYDNVHWGSCLNPVKSCYVSGAVPLLGKCEQGMVPNFYIDAKGVDDIRAGLEFVQQHDINLVVKNSGHDYRGRSSGQDSLAIWTHNIQPDIEVDQQFTPEGCQNSAGPALTFGAGQGFEGIYKTAHEHGFQVVGGTSPTVGASGGWLTGGGHSALSPTLGLGVDNALQIRAVLPNGTFITANRCQNQDMFFALRGGGGNAFGIITETTTRAHPETPLQMAFIAGLSLHPDAARKITEILIDNTPKWSQDGWGGYAAGIGPVAFVALITPKLSLEEAKLSMKPLSDYLGSLGGVPIALQFQTLANYWEYYQSPIAQALSEQGVGTGMITSSRLVSQDLFHGQQNKDKLSNAMSQIVSNLFTKGYSPFGILLVPPANYSLPDSDLPGGPGEASITPAWRNSYWHALFAGTYDTVLEDPAKAFTDISASADVLRQITPGGGAYQNEGDAFEPDPPSAFWGSTYDRLLSIKEAIDPHNILTCHQCVGWDPLDPRWGCFPKVKR